MTDREEEKFRLEEEDEDLFAEVGKSPQERERELRRALTGKAPPPEPPWEARTSGEPEEEGSPSRPPEETGGGGPRGKGRQAPVSRLLLLVLLLVVAGAAAYYLLLSPGDPGPQPEPVRVVRKPEPVAIPEPPLAPPAEPGREAPAEPPEAQPSPKAVEASEPPEEAAPVAPTPPAEAEPPPITVAEQPPAPTDGYLLRVGAFLDPVNLDAVLASLRELGFAPETRGVTGRSRMVRLLEGSYAPEAGRVRLAELSVAAPGAFAIHRDGRLFLYAGSFRDPENARETAAKLAAAGIQVTEETAEVEVPLTLVRVGPFSDRAAAEAAAERIREQGLEADLAPSR